MVARRHPFLSLRARIALLIFMSQVVLIAALTLLQSYHQYLASRELLKEASISYGRCIGHACRQALATSDWPRLRSVLEEGRLAHQRDVEYIMLQDERGRVVSSTEESLIDRILDAPPRYDQAPDGVVFRERTSSDDHAGLPSSQYELFISAPSDDESSLSIRMGLTDRFIREAILALTLRGLPVVVIGGAIGWILAHYADRRLTSSLRELSRASVAMAEGDLSRSVAISTGDELEALGHSFNAMASRLAESHRQLVQHEAQLENRVRDRTAELSAEKQKLNGIIGAIGAGIVLLDRDRNVRWMNKMAHDWFGPTETWRGRGCPETLIHPPGSATSPGTSVPETWEKVNRTAAGNVAHFQVSASPILDRSGQTIETLALVQDVTELKQLQARLIHAGKMVAIGELASGIAHQLNNPLAVITTHVERMGEIVARQPPTGDDRFARFPEYVSVVRKHLLRSRDVIEKLLGFARGKAAELQTTDINCIIGDAASLVEHRAVVEGKTMVLDLVPGPPCFRTDPDSVVQIILNLLNNAFDATERGATITVRSKAERSHVTCSVHDDGPGFDPSDADLLFEPFFTTKPPGKGTGLGLAMSATIIGRLGGRIQARRGIEGGATFEITLPTDDDQRTGTP